MIEWKHCGVAAAKQVLLASAKAYRAASPSLSSSSTSCSKMSSSTNEGNLSKALSVMLSTWDVKEDRRRSKIAQRAK